MGGQHPKSTLRSKTLEFAQLAIAYSSQLKERNEFALANQFVRSATSIGANVFEAGRK